MPPGGVLTRSGGGYFASDSKARLPFNLRIQALYPARAGSPVLWMPAPQGEGLEAPETAGEGSLSPPGPQPVLGEVLRLRFSGLRSFEATKGLRWRSSKLYWAEARSRHTLLWSRTISAAGHPWPKLTMKEKASGSPCRAWA